MLITRRRVLATAALAMARAASGAQPAAPLVAGAVFALSGSLALTGEESLRGVQLAAPSALAVADAFDQDHAGPAVNGLITNGHAGLLVGTGSSELSYSGSAAAELAQVPYIELNAPADGITARGFKFLLRTGPTTSMIANLAVQTLTARFAGRRVGLLFNTGATAGAVAGLVLAALNTAKAPPMLAIGYAPGVADLVDATGRLMRAKVEVLLHAAGPDDVLALFAGMREQAWRPRALLGCGDGYLLRETAFALGTDFEGTWAIGAPMAAPAGYEARFGMAPRSPDSLTAYVGTKLVFDTLNAVGGDASKLLDALRKTDIPAGGLANGWGVAFDRNGQNTRSFVTLQEWRQGELSEVS